MKALNVIQAVGWYFPDSSGGSEVYVQALSQWLRNNQFHCRVTAPLDGNDEQKYVYQGIPVYRYPVSPNPTLSQVRGEAHHCGWYRFTEWLRRHAGGIYHQHSWTLGCGAAHLKYAKSLGMKTVLTIHVPAPICLRGTMLLFGEEPCDGRIDRQRCGACWATSMGLSRFASGLLARLPLALSKNAKSRLPSSKVNTALSWPALTHAHLSRFQEMVSSADRIVAVSNWLHEALLVNGVPRGKLNYCPQGVALRRAPNFPRSDGPNPVLKICFLGRCDPVKGIEMLVDAVKMVPKRYPLSLVIFALEGGEEDYRRRIQAAAINEPRIQFKKPLERDQLLSHLAEFDALAVPSLWLETGPHVVLEALAAGVPVLGSDLGGIRELVEHGVNGWLLPPGEAQIWAASLIEFIRTPERLRKLRGQGSNPRNMEDVSSEMAELYASLTSDIS